MGIIRIDSIKDESRVSKQGKKYNVTCVRGTYYGSDDEWQQDIFKNDKKMLRKLEEFGKGDVANFVYEKNGTYFDLVDIREPEAEYLSKIDNGEVETGKPKKKYEKQTAKSTGNSNSMSKEEWAEKDRLTNIRIAKAVALKAAIDAGKKTVKTIIPFAEELLPWLLDPEIAIVGDLDDPLDPPA